MSQQYIKLSSIIINPRYITHINLVTDGLKVNNYFINLQCNKWSMDGSWFYFSGESLKKEIQISKFNNPSDFKIMSEWIDKN